jgi:hypothetical protein
MTPTVLFTLGTPLEGWGPVAQELLARAPAGLDLNQARFRECFDALAGEGRSLSVPAFATGEKQADALAKLAALGGGSTSPWGGMDARAVWALDTLAAQHPRAGFLVFVESPAEALAAWLAAGAPGDVRAALDLWCAGAERILRHVQRHPARCLLVAADEARRWPALATAVCRERLGLDFKAPPTDLAHPSADPLTLFIAQAGAAQHPRAQALHAELHLACLPLSDDAALAAPSSSLAELPAAVAQLRRLEAARAEAEALATRQRALQAEAQRTAAETAALRGENEEMLGQLHAVQEQEAARLVDAARLRQEHDRLRANHEALDQLHRTAVSERDAARAEIERLRSNESLLQRDLAVARETEHALRTQLVQLEVADASRAEQARSEIEKARGQADAAEREIAAVQQQLATLQAAHQALQGELRSAQKEGQALQENARRQADAAERELASTRQTAERQLAAVQQQLATLEAAHQALQGELRSAQREGQALRGQLHQVQAALELQHQATLRLDERLPYHLAAGQAGVSVAGVALGAAHDTPPHRGLDVELTAVTSGDAPAFTLPARLVEHHGRAGLVIFQCPGLPLPPERVSGREGDRPFMLVMPGDAASVPLLGALGARDWILVNTVAAQIDKALRVDPAAAPRWRAVSRRLRQGLDALPHPLRYDRVQAAPLAKGAGLKLRFDGVECGGRVFSGLDLCYRPQGAGGVLELLARPDAPEGPPLDGWPVGDDGSLAASMAFTVGTAGARAARRQQWAGLLPADRELLLALLAALPGATAQAGAAAAVPLPGLHAQALHDLQPSALRRLARALRGRGPAVA